MTQNDDSAREKLETLPSIGIKEQVLAKRIQLVNCGCLLVIREESTPNTVTKFWQQVVMIPTTDNTNIQIGNLVLQVGNTRCI
jgi:hypothetical protein